MKLSVLRRLWALPLLLVVIYYGKIASDGYVSHATAVIKSTDIPMGKSTGLMSFFNVKSSSVKDLYLIQKYLLSREVFSKLVADLKLDAHYAKESVDWISRLNAEAPIEVKYRYFVKKLNVTIDESNNTLDLAVVTYDAALSTDVLKHLLRYGEQFINKLDRGLLDDKLASAKAMVDQSEQQLRDIHGEILQFQNVNHTLSPTGESSNRLKIINSLESSLSKAYAELRQLQRLYHNNAPKVRAKRFEIDALKAQLKSERSATVGEEGTKLNRLTVDYESLRLEEQFAREKYNSALAVLEAAHKEMGTSFKRLLVLSPPTLPDYPEEPMRMQIILAWVLGYMMLIGIVRLFFKAAST